MNMITGIYINVMKDFIIAMLCLYAKKKDFCQNGQVQILPPFVFVRARSKVGEAGKVRLGILARLRFKANVGV